VLAAVAAACIPIFITRDVVDVPFSYKIDWKRMSVKWGGDGGPSLLSHLSHIPAVDVEAALIYMEQVHSP
jgi:hypothetical protein